MKNQILIIICTVLISLCIGLAIPNVMGGKVQGLQVDQEQLKRNAAKQFEEEMQRLVLEDFEKRVNVQMRAQIAEGTKKLAVLTGSTAKKIEAEFSKEAEKIYKDANNVDKAKAAVLAELVDSSPVPAGAAVVKGEKSSAADVKSDSIQSKIDANRDKIDDADLQEGKVLYNSVDAGYLSDLMADGLTPEEDAEMQAYLHSRFSAGEYERAKELYYKYVDLMSE